MRKYCKAYHLKDLRQFPSWNAHWQKEEELTEDTVVYLWDDFTVVKSPVLAEQGVLWKDVTPEWKAFCRETLHFEIPADLRYAYEQDAQEQSTVEAKGPEEKSTPLGERE
ncbi:MAG TPA: hypothetical protein VFV38_01125 [Ktedonobacteraceae bacterium]|nr:hypothetical protein [Ktedonobacteraceae bacterium]